MKKDQQSLACFTILSEKNPLILQELISLFVKQHYMIERLVQSSTDNNDLNVILIQCRLVEAPALSLIAMISKMIGITAVEVHMLSPSDATYVGLYSMHKTDASIDVIRQIQKAGASLVDSYGDTLVFEKRGSEHDLRHFYNKIESQNLVGYYTLPIFPGVQMNGHV